MIKNPFRKPPPPPPQEEEKPNLDTQITDLEKKSFNLHSLITAEKHIPTKQRLIQERSEIVSQINTLKAKQNTPKEQEASTQIDKLFNDPNLTYALEIGGYRTRPDKNLNITLKFKPCAHEKTIHIKELLSFQKAIPSPEHKEQYLFSKWQNLLRNNATLTAGFTCEECRKTKEKKLREQHRHSYADTIGTVNVTMTIL